MSKERSFVVQPPALNALINLLRSHNYSVVGPTLRDGVVVLDLIERFDRALIGVESASGPGAYRIKDREGAVFGGPVEPVSRTTSQWS